MMDSERPNRPSVRIAPLPRDEWSHEAVAALSILPPEMLPPPGTTINSLSVLAHHPDLAAAHLGFSLYLRFRSSLSDRVRELLILRTAWLRGAEYELLRHAQKAGREGFSQDEIARIAIGSAAPEWDPLEALLLRAVEELCRDFCVGEETWSALAEHHSRQQLMDIVFTVGAYNMLAMAFNSFGVAPEAGLPPFPPACERPS